MSLRVYVEGGGDNHSALAGKCRSSFATFLERAGFRGRLPRVVPCGGRQEAYKSFCRALRMGEKAMLLVDSEAPVSPNARKWQHVRDRVSDAWEQPSSATERDLHLMVQTMESWFHADKRAIAVYFGAGFRESALSQNDSIEAISKRDVEDGLAEATRSSGKGRYSKGRHSFEILSLIDPAKVRAASPHADQFLTELNRSLTAPQSSPGF